MNTPPAEVQVRCLMGCRTDTLHRLQAVLGGRPLYLCSNSCGAPPREISDPHLKTPAARAAEADMIAMQQAKWKREAEQSLAIDARPFKTIAAYKAATETKPHKETTTMKDKLITLIRKTVAEQIGEQEKPLTEDHVRGMIREELEKLLSDDEDHGDRPRRPATASGEDAPVACKHKNFMRKCDSCQRRRAGADE